MNVHGERFLPSTASAGATETHQSSTDPEARLARKGAAKEARLYYSGNALMENLSGALIDTADFIASCRDSRSLRTWRRMVPTLKLQREIVQARRRLARSNLRLDAMMMKMMKEQRPADRRVKKPDLRCVLRLTRDIAQLPAFLLALAAFLTALLVQSGELGSIDTTIRLQTTHSYWTSKPAVPDQSVVKWGFGAVAVGKNGRMYAAYGMGQSLLMLPSDIVGTLLEHLFPHPGLRSIVVSYNTNVFVCVLTVLVCFRWLRLLEFTPSQGMAGALALLFGTTFLHYTQNMMENNLMFLLTLTGLCFQYEWLRTGSIRSLVIGCLALGANLLVRLTTAMDVAAVGLFLLLVLLWKRRVRGREMLTCIWSYVRVAGPCYAVFLLIDRAYQYKRFGSIFNTYLSVSAEQQKLADPSLPPNHPWSTPLHVGLLGPLITPEKSIFLFDPLILLTILLGLLLWKRLQPEIKALVVTGFTLLAMYILFYAKYNDWSGDIAWGDRYITTPVQLLAMIAIPLLLRHRLDLRKFVPRLGMAIACVSVVIQLASVVFWSQLEFDQMETLGHPTFVIGLRFENIAAVARGKVNGWSLADTPYFLPFPLKKHLVSKRAANGLIAGWSVCLAVLILVLWIIQRKTRRGDFAAGAGGERLAKLATRVTVK